MAVFSHSPPAGKTEPCFPVRRISMQSPPFLITRGPETYSVCLICSKNTLQNVNRDTLLSVTYCKPCFDICQHIYVNRRPVFFPLPLTSSGNSARKRNPSAAPIRREQGQRPQGIKKLPRGTAGAIILFLPFSRQSPMRPSCSADSDHDGAFTDSGPPPQTFRRSAGRRGRCPPGKAPGRRG